MALIKTRIFSESRKTEFRFDLVINVIQRGSQFHDDDDVFSRLTFC